MRQTIILLLLVGLSSCVSKKKYQALQKENAGLKRKVEALDKQNTAFNNKLVELTKELKDKK